LLTIRKNWQTAPQTVGPVFLCQDASFINSRASGVLDADMCPIHGKSADRMRQTCPNCKRSKILKLVKPAEEQPRKNYCIECGHEWWEFDKKPVASADPRGM
jgi:Zn ribbon nucleic-acid-binding protein